MNAGAKFKRALKSKGKILILILLIRKKPGDMARGTGSAAGSHLLSNTGYQTKPSVMVQSLTETVWSRHRSSFAHKD